MPDELSKIIVERYDPAWNVHSMVANESGAYVHSDDYDAMYNELEALRKRCEGMEKALKEIHTRAFGGGSDEHDMDLSLDWIRAKAYSQLWPKPAALTTSERGEA